MRRVEQETQSQAAAPLTAGERRIVERFIPLAKACAWRRWLERGSRYYSWADWCQVAYLGLVAAVLAWRDRETRRRWRFSQLVGPCVKRACHEFAMSNCRAVSTPFRDVSRARRGGGGGHMTESRRRLICERGQGRPLACLENDGDRHHGRAGGAIRRPESQTETVELSDKRRMVHAALRDMAARQRGARRQAAKLMLTDRFPLPESCWRLSYSEVVQRTGLTYKQAENLEVGLLRGAHCLVLQRLASRRAAGPASAALERQALLVVVGQAAGAKALPAIILAACRLLVPPAARRFPLAMVCQWIGLSRGAAQRMELDMRLAAEGRLAREGAAA